MTRNNYVLLCFRQLMNIVLSPGVSVHLFVSVTKQRIRHDYSAEDILWWQGRNYILTNTYTHTHTKNSDMYALCIIQTENLTMTAVVIFIHFAIPGRMRQPCDTPGNCWQRNCMRRKYFIKLKIKVIVSWWFWR